MDFNDRGTRPALRPPAAEDTIDGNYDTRSLDFDTRLGIRCALSAGVLRGARGTVSFLLLTPFIRVRARSGTLLQGLPSDDGGPRMGCRSDRSVCHLSVVS